MHEGDATTHSQHTMSNLLRLIGALGDELSGEFDTLSTRMNELELQTQSSQASIAELEDRLANLLAERTNDRTDLHTTAHLTHIGLAADYHSLVMQWMQRVARKVIKEPTRQRFEFELGRQVAVFTGHLFRGDRPDTDGLLSSLQLADKDALHLAVAMCARAAKLREKIASIGVYQEWDFRTDPSGILDEERQEAWLTCDPSESVVLVVAPAYLVQGVVYAKQLVATEQTAFKK